MHVCTECGQGYERAGFCAADGHPLAEATDPLLGTQVLRYRLARLIGRGGMGNVYLGVQPEIGSRVAVKVLSIECARAPDLVERFFAEARAVNLIRHENIVSVIDMAKLPDGRPFIVMEYVEGVTLSRLIKDGTAPLGGIVQVFGDVLSGLAAAHEIGIVHRDLKPDNILVTGKGHAKVLDFGIAKLAPALRDGASAPTQTGALLGTPAYMAPEQISGTTNVDGRTDIYGAGVVLFEAVTGRVPFAGTTLFDMMRAQLEQAPPSPRAMRPDLPESMEAVILTALAKKAEHRFQSATAMANALEQAATVLPQDQWRELTTRSTPMPRASGPRIRPSTTQPPPRTIHRDTPPAISAVNVPVQDKETAKRSRTPLVLAVLGMAAAAATGAVIATTMMRGDDPAPVATPVVIAPVEPKLVEPADESRLEKAPVEPSDESRLEQAPDKKAPGEKAPVEKPPVEKPPISKAPDKQDRSPAAPTPKPPVVATTPRPTPAASPTRPAATAAEERRAQIAAEYRMHKDHVALPGEVPIKRRPRMSRGTYDPRNFDYRAFLPQATKLARAEFADAKLVMFEVGGVTPDGKANITIDNRGAEFRFASKTPIDEGCSVVVAVKAKAIETYVESSFGCADGVPLPRCSFREVWTKASAIGTQSTRANLSYNKNGWVFGATDLFHSIDDDCP